MVSFRSVGAASLLWAFIASAGCQASRDSQPKQCRVTQPNGQTFTGKPDGGHHGNEFLVVGLWPAGVVDFSEKGPGQRLPDGSLAMKFWWWRRVRGKLTIEGHRLDGPATPLRGIVPEGYGTQGFQASEIIFPGPGCWEVTGRVGAGKLTFVTQVVTRE